MIGLYFRGFKERRLSQACREYRETKEVIVHKGGRFTPCQSQVRCCSLLPLSRYGLTIVLELQQRVQYSLKDYSSCSFAVLGLQPA